MVIPVPSSDLKAERIQALLDNLSAYIEQYHGGSVEMDGFSEKENAVTVRLGGACLGCPLSPITLHGWVEGTLKQFFPEIRVKAETDSES